MNGERVNIIVIGDGSMIKNVDSGVESSFLSNFESSQKLHLMYLMLSSLTKSHAPLPPHPPNHTSLVGQKVWFMTSFTRLVLDNIFF